MFLKIHRIFLLIFVLIEVSEQSKEYKTNCNVIKNNDELCASYCYTIVKPLLQYAASVKSKEQQFIELESKVYNLELTINHLEEIIKNKEIQLATQIELAQVYKEKNIISEELIKEKNKELSNIYKEKNIINEQLIKEKNKQISDKQTQLLQHLNFRSEATPIENNTENVKIDNKLPDILPSPISISIPSHTKEKSNEYQNYVLISPIKEPENYAPAEIRKLEESPNTFLKYMGVNCIGKSTDAYMFKLPGIEKFVLPCDSKLIGSGWTVIQRRQDGTENFDRNWTEYRMGFGNPQNEFFIGLEKLHLITNAQPHDLYIYLEDFNNDIRYALYKNFAIGNEKESYALKTLGEYSGNAEDALSNHKNMKFSTADHYFDGGLNCAANFNSGWWFNDGCYQCNLNAPYVSGNAENSHGIEWRTWHFKPLKFVQMMIKPNNIK